MAYKVNKNILLRLKVNGKRVYDFSDKELQEIEKTYYGNKLDTEKVIIEMEKISNKLKDKSKLNSQDLIIGMELINRLSGVKKGDLKTQRELIVLIDLALKIEPTFLVTLKELYIQTFNIKKENNHLKEK
jgi:hypothetical protein